MRSKKELTERFNEILNEYTTFDNGGMVEADDNKDEGGAQDAPMMDAPQDAPMGGGPEGGAPEGPMEGGPQGGMPQDGMQPGRQEAPAGLDVQDDGAQGDMGGMPQDDMGGEVGADDDVIDISDLVDAQEDTDDKLSVIGKEVKSKFDKIISQIDSFEDMIQSNNDKIHQLQAELEKRAPSQEEKLTMRTAQSYPYTETPKQYWDEKQKTSNYSVEDDENGVNQEQYKITANDLNTMDWRNISKSLEDKMYGQMMGGIPY